MKPRGLLFAGLLLVIAYLLYDRSRTPEHLPPPQPAVEASRSSATEPARSIAAASGVSRPAPALAPTPPPAAPAAPASMNDRIAHIETVFDQQSVDGGWATGATARLEQGLSRIAKGTRDLAQIECRSSLCRARYDGADPSQCEAFARDAAHQTAPYFWEGPYTVRIDPAGAGTRCSVSMLFGREGTDLPSID